MAALAMMAAGLVAAPAVVEIKLVARRPAK